MVKPPKDWNRDASCALELEEHYPAVLDTVIVGAGPAGLTAAIYTARRKLRTLLVTGETGGQMLSCSDIQNWTGVAQATGPQLVGSFFDHVRQVDRDNAHFDLWLREGERVTTIKPLADKHYAVVTDGGKTFETKTVIITTGKRPRMLGIPGEAVAVRGNGLSFSATSDAPLYRGKKMLVIGGGNSGMDVALQLAKYTDDITLVTNLDHLIGEACLMEKVKRDPKIAVKYNVLTQEILLNEHDKVRGVLWHEGDGALTEFVCEGIFEEIGQMPATEWLDGVLDLDDRGQIVVDKDGRTSLPGVFAGGDCTNATYKQVVIAAGAGAVAALSAHGYLLEVH